MKKYLVAYRTTTSFGRIFMAVDAPITEEMIIKWEKRIAERIDTTKVIITNFVEVAG